MTEILLLLAVVLLVVFAAAGLVWPTIIALGVVAVCCLVAAERTTGDPS